MTAAKIYDASNPIHHNTPAATFVIKNPGVPATPAQISFLESLVAKRDHELCPKVAFVLASNAATKGKASEWITALKAAPFKLTATFEDVAADMKAGNAVTEELPTPEFGYYQAGENLFHFEMMPLYKGGSKMTPKLFKLIKGQVYSPKAGKVVPKGKWAYAGGALDGKKKLAGATKISVAQAGKLGLSYGFCIRCGRYLSDPVSVANGIGPVCATYAGWM
jgi:hypothetical protein